MPSTRITYTCSIEKLQQLEELLKPINKTPQEIIDWLIDLYLLKRVSYPDGAISVDQLLARLSMATPGTGAYSADTEDIEEPRKKQPLKAAKVAIANPATDKAWRKATEKWKACKTALDSYLKRHKHDDQEWYKYVSAYVYVAVVGRYDEGTPYTNEQIWTQKRHEARADFLEAFTTKLDKCQDSPDKILDRVWDDLTTNPYDEVEQSDDYNDWELDHYEYKKVSAELLNVVHKPDTEVWKPRSVYNKTVDTYMQTLQDTWEICVAKGDITDYRILKLMYSAEGDSFYTTGNIAVMRNDPALRMMFDYNSKEPAKNKEVYFENARAVITKLCAQ